VQRAQDPLAVLDDALEVAGRVVVDVGCGDGALVRHLAACGANAIGVETGQEPLRRARAADPVAGERYLEGVAEALPLDAGSADAIVFKHSLHHVGDLDRALAEAARVLRPGGTLYVEEPVARGAFFELLRPVDDETEVRANAYAALATAAAHGLAPERELEFDAAVVLEDFEGLRDRIVMADAQRAERFGALAGELRTRFDETAEQVDGRYRFLQPMRVNVLRRR
jgi:hypothetical protein